MSSSTQPLRHFVTLPLVITIDGPAGVGKSTAAKLLAKRLGLMYLDTGATYRALAYTALRARIDLSDRTRLAHVGRALRIKLEPLPSGGVRVLLNGEDVTRQIRTERVTEVAAVLAQYPSVRHALVALQRRLARARGVVAEGRDTGSVVFPHATHKFFLTADVQVRAARRQQELRQLHGASASHATIARQLQARDAMDTRRRVGPLVTPSGAIIIDTTHVAAQQVVEWMLRHLPASVCVCNGSS